MIHWIRFAVRTGSLAYALWRARAFPLFFLYFTASLGDSICEEITFQFWGDSSAIYFWTYAAGTALILFFALWIAWDAIPAPYRLRKCAIPAVLAVSVGRMVVLGCGKLDSSGWILLATGAILFFCGQILSTAAAYARQNHTALFILGTLWLIQATYFFGYLLHAPEWEATGYWAPALITSAGFVAAALKLRPIRNGLGRDAVATGHPI